MCPDSNLSIEAARLPKYMELRDRIRRQIESGKLPPGSAIPTEPELAKRHQVSVSTVKEALKDLVKEGLITRVRGRGTFVREDLRSARTVLPLLTPMLGQGLTREFYAGYEERSLEHGRSTMLYSTRQLLEGPLESWQDHPVLKGTHSFTMIASAVGQDAYERDLRVVRSLLAAGKNVIVVDQFLPDISSDEQHIIFLGARNFDAMREVGRHLVQTGRKRFGFVGITDGGYTQQQRLSGLYLAAIDSGGAARVEEPLLLDKELVDAPLANGEVLPKADAERIVAYGRKCDALCAVNDGIAALTIRALRERGLAVPQDCAVTGFDDSEIASATTPPLTTVRQPFRQMGHSAVDLLLGLESGRLRGPARWIVESTLVVRESSQPQ